jgi:hypothetical protein
MKILTRWWKRYRAHRERTNRSYEHLKSFWGEW